MSEKKREVCVYIYCLCVCLNMYTHTVVYAESPVSQRTHTHTQAARYALLSTLVNVLLPASVSEFFHQKRKWKTQSCVGEGRGGRLVVEVREKRVWESKRREREREDVHIWSCSMALSLGGGGQLHTHTHTHTYKQAPWIYRKEEAGGEVTPGRKWQKERSGDLKCII